MALLKMHQVQLHLCKYYFITLLLSVERYLTSTPYICPYLTLKTILFHGYESLSKSEYSIIILFQHMHIYDKTVKLSLNRDDYYTLFTCNTLLMLL